MQDGMHFQICKYSGALLLRSLTVPSPWSGGVCRVELRGVSLGVKTVFLLSRHQGGGTFSGRARAGARLQEVTCGAGAKLQHPACRACSHADGDQVMSQPRWLRGGGAGE